MGMPLPVGLTSLGGIQHTCRGLGEMVGVKEDRARDPEGITLYLPQ